LGRKCPEIAHESDPTRVVAKVEWHLGEFFPRVGFIVTNTRQFSTNARDADMRHASVIVAIPKRREICAQMSRKPAPLVRLGSKTGSTTARTPSLEAPRLANRAGGRQSDGELLRHLGYPG
jgi:hypothetical protein